MRVAEAAGILAEEEIEVDRDRDRGCGPEIRV
jgi:hypothetical protein